MVFSSGNGVKAKKRKAFIPIFAAMRAVAGLLD